MKPFKLFVLATVFLLTSCQTVKALVTITDSGQAYVLHSGQRTPASLLAEAGLTLGPDDRLLFLGSPVSPEAALPAATNYALEVRRAVALTIVAPDVQKTVQTSAITIGQALTEVGYTLYAADRLDPPAETPLTGPLTVNYQPARELIVSVDGSQVRLRSAASTVGQALAEAGLPLVGLDYAVPPEAAPLPADGQLRLVHVTESVALTQKSIAFHTTDQLTADLEIDQSTLLQGGEPGLAIARLRTRSEDGVQISQVSEGESLVRPAQDRIVGYGTKIVVRTTVVEGVTIEYWRALTLYATNYSPCNSAGEPGKCYYFTASRKKVQQGVVAFVYGWYVLFRGQPLYVTRYGYATVEDVGGGCPPAAGALGCPAGGHSWIDQGWSEEEAPNRPTGISGWKTVYFLTPVPANPVYVLP